MPLSYYTYGPLILIMVVILSLNQLVRYMRQKRSRSH